MPILLRSTLTTAATAGNDFDGVIGVVPIRRNGPTGAGREKDNDGAGTSIRAWRAKNE